MGTWHHRGFRVEGLGRNGLAPLLLGLYIDVFICLQDICMPCTHAYTRARAHTHTNTHTHTRNICPPFSFTHTHTHTPSPSLPPFLSLSVSLVRRWAMQPGAKAKGGAGGAMGGAEVEWTDEELDRQTRYFQVK